MSSLGGRVLLTGATGGLGQAMARALAARGARLVLTGRRRELLESLAAELSAEVLVADLARAEDLDQVLSAIRSDPLDLLVANAALPATGRLEEIDPEEVDRILEVNLRAPIRLAQVAVHDMVARGHGHIVFIGSLSGKVATPLSSLYSATKFGLRGFALGLREDLMASGVGVSIVQPGFVREAGMFAGTGVKLPRGVGTTAPEDVAAAVLRAVEENRAEIDVAPLAMRLGTAFAALAPQVSASLSRRMGSQRIAGEVDAGHKRREGAEG